MHAKETIRCGDRVVGTVTIAGFSMWTVYGPFTPGPDFRLYADAINHVRDLQRSAESDPDVDWLDALEVVNDFGFVAESSNGLSTPIRDFQLDDNNKAEYKPDSWPPTRDTR